MDLNAVRAGIVCDPKDYRWSGYAEAVAGNSKAQKGLGMLLHREAAANNGKQVDWRVVGREYRILLFGTGEEQLAIDDKTVLKRGMTREEVEAVWAAGGKLSLPELLRCKLRYFSDGLVIGSKSFVDQFFESKRDYFSATRKDGSRHMRGGHRGTLRSARDLLKNPIG